MLNICVARYCGGIEPCCYYQRQVFTTDSTSLVILAAWRHKWWLRVVGHSCRSIRLTQKMKDSYRESQCNAFWYGTYCGWKRDHASSKVNVDYLSFAKTYPEVFSLFPHPFPLLYPGQWEELNAQITRLALNARRSFNTWTTFRPFYSRYARDTLHSSFPFANADAPVFATSNQHGSFPSRFIQIATKLGLVDLLLRWKDISA